MALNVLVIFQVQFRFLTNSRLILLVFSLLMYRLSSEGCLCGLGPFALYFLQDMFVPEISLQHLFLISL